MIPALIGLAAASCAELLLWEVFWRWHEAFAVSLAAVLALAGSALLIVNPAAWTLLLAILTAYRCLNLGRVAAGRIQTDYLFHASRRTCYWLMGSQLLLMTLAYMERRYKFGAATWWALAADFMLLASAVTLESVLRHLRTTKPPRAAGLPARSGLPSLTVAIPARNETTDLEECLESLLGSTYPKLEIVVLDDCSQDKRTPEIIRGFAHAGVRFVAGKQPPAGWLAKNYAYEQLAKEANGELLLFCGVDVRFRPYSVERLVALLQQKRKSMISILPRDEFPSSRGAASWFMQPNRYAWELALPRRLLQRPPVLSTCWLITRQALENGGGFGAVRRKGVPESYLARISAGNDDGYSFLQSDDDMGISSRKSPDEQRSTAVRTRYLQLHRRLEMTALVSLSEAAALCLPPVLTIAALIQGWWLVAALAATSFAFGTMAYARIFNLAYRRFMLKGCWLLPLAAAYDIALLNYSTWKYEFGEVLWKGRNVCIPVMRIGPADPKPPQARSRA